MEHRKVINVGAWVEYNKAINRYRVRYTNIKGEIRSLTRTVCSPNVIHKPFEIEQQFKWKWVAKEFRRDLDVRLLRDVTNYAGNLDKWVKI